MLSFKLKKQTSKNVADTTFKKQIEKHKQDRLTNANQDTVFSENLDESKIIRDVLLSSVKSAIDNLI